MTERRRYTKRQKAEVVGRAIATSNLATSEATGVPESTIRYWRQLPDFAILRDKTRDDVAAEMWSAIQIGLEEVAKGLRGDAPLRDKATALGILYDKHALLTGEATTRSEHRDITDADDAGLDTLEQVLSANSPFAPTAGLGVRGNGAGPNGQH